MQHWTPTVQNSTQHWTQHGNNRLARSSRKHQLFCHFAQEYGKGFGLKLRHRHFSTKPKWHLVFPRCFKHNIDIFLAHVSQSSRRNNYFCLTSFHLFPRGLPCVCIILAKVVWKVTWSICRQIRCKSQFLLCSLQNYYMYYAFVFDATSWHHTGVWRKYWM